LKKRNDFIEIYCADGHPKAVFKSLKALKKHRSRDHTPSLKDTVNTPLYKCTEGLTIKEIEDNRHCASFKTIASLKKHIAEKHRIKSLTTINDGTQKILA